MPNLLLENTKYLKNKLGLFTMAQYFFVEGYCSPEDLMNFASALEKCSENDNELVIKLYMDLYSIGLCKSDKLLSIIENPEIKNDSLAFYLLKADVYERIKENDKAINCLKTAILLNKEREDHYLWRINKLKNGN